MRKNWEGFTFEQDGAAYRVIASSEQFGWWAEPLERPADEEAWAESCITVETSFLNHEMMRRVRAKLKPVPAPTLLPAILTRLENQDWQAGKEFSAWLDAMKPLRLPFSHKLEMPRWYWQGLAFPWAAEGWTQMQRDTAIDYEAGKQKREQDDALREMNRYLADFRTMAVAVGAWLEGFSRPLKPEGRARVMATDLAALVKAAHKTMPTKKRRAETCKTYAQASKFWDAMFDRVQISTLGNRLVAHQWVIDDEGEMQPVGTVTPYTRCFENAPLVASVELTALYDWLCKKPYDNRKASEDGKGALELRLTRGGSLEITTDPALRLRSRVRLPHNATYLIEA